MSSRPLPPPNRTCGSPAYGSPVRGFTCNRTDGALHRLRPSRTAPVAQSRRWASVVCRRTQVLRRSDFVEQTVPTSAFNPLVEGSQHALGPHRWFDPSLVDLSDGFSRLGHLGQVSVHRCVSIASPFLPPLARTPLEGLHSYYGGSDSCPALLAAGQVSLVHLLHRGPPSVANHPWSSYGSFVSYPYRTVGVHRIRLRLWLAGSPRSKAETRFSSYGRGIPLGLLSTPPRGDAVIFGYRPGELWPDGDLHPADGVCSKAH